MWSDRWNQIQFYIFLFIFSIQFVRASLRFVFSFHFIFNLSFVFIRSTKHINAHSTRRKVSIVLMMFARLRYKFSLTAENLRFQYFIDIFWFYFFLASWNRAQRFFSLSVFYGIFAIIAIFIFFFNVFRFIQMWWWNYD